MKNEARLAEYWELREDKRIECKLCPRYCKVKENQKGLCRIRKNIDNKLYATGYGKISAMNIDPMEKKPLYHYYPGSYILSIGVAGCNLTCKFCQNWSLSQEEENGQYFSPQELIQTVKNYGGPGICFTYSEPLIWFEYIKDVAKIAKPLGYKIVLVTNGYINEEPLKEICDYIDSANIDLKFFNDNTYNRISGGKLDAVKNTISIMYKKGVHIEVTHLVVTDVNDKEDEFHGLVEWIENISPFIPLHISRYFPQYKFKNPPTSLKTLENFLEIARKKLYYVYVGNVYANNGSNTYCPNCNNILISRNGYNVKIHFNKDEKICPVCKRKVDIKFD